MRQTSLKRYKYVGKERDEETRLYYYGARYYAAWICRFVSVDPMKEERIWLNHYNYVQNNTVNRVDPNWTLDNNRNDVPKDNSFKKRVQGDSNYELSAENKKFFKNVYTYIDSEITKYEDKLNK